MATKAIEVLAPATPDLKHPTSIFLAGTLSPPTEPCWRKTLTSTLFSYPVTIFNPVRNDWDATWKESFSDPRWATQVEWELTMQEKADIVVVYFHDQGLSPISMLEFGLCVRSGKAVVCARPGFTKRGNVEAVCRRYGAPFVSSEHELAVAVKQRLERDFGLSAR